MNINPKPTADLSNSDGNVFSLLATCTRALKKAGCRDLAEELRVKVMAAGSYDEAIQIMMTYVDVE